MSRSASTSNRIERLANDRGIWRPGLKRGARAADTFTCGNVPQPRAALLADDHVECGRLLLRSGKYPEALGSFDAALQLRKEHSMGQRLRAEALFHLGRFQEAHQLSTEGLTKRTGLELDRVKRLLRLARAPKSSRRRVMRASWSTRGMNTAP